MLFGQILVSAMVVLAWSMVWADWRNPGAGRNRGPRGGAFLAGKREGMLPLVAGLTLVAAGGWVFYFSPTGPDGAAAGPGHYIGGFLIGSGLVGVACFISIYWTGRPRFMIPPALRQKQPSVSYRPAHAAAPTAPVVSAAWAPTLGEEVAGVFTANHLQNDYLCRGRLFVTRERLVYVPGTHSATNGGLGWEMSLDRIVEARTARRDLLDAWGGGWRRRLSVRTWDGRTEYFVVWRPRKTAGLIESLRPESFQRT